METVIVLLVLCVLIVLFGGVGYFFIRETGWENARLWLQGPRQVRRFTATNQDSGANPGTASFSERVRNPRRAEQGQMEIALDDTALRNLREELRSEITRAAGLTRDFDMRLTRMEADVSSTKQLPEEIDKSIQQTVNEVEVRTRTRITRIRGELRAARKADSPFGQRRADSLAELYSQLAQVEAALAAVVNPMLLPGEPLRVPDELFEDTLDWENWNDVGDRAYGFGGVFNQRRIVLQPELADQIERFIATFRQALTDTVSPVVQNPQRTPAQIAQMRHGLRTIIDALPPLRRELESAYRDISAAQARDDDDEDDDA